MERLDKVLSNSGYGTRSEIKKLIKSKVVSVDGVFANDSGAKVDPKANLIEIHGMPINYRKFIYLLMNKPEGVISATFDNKHKTVIDLLSEEHQHFEPFPVGRLDIDTTGLLILTNDGDFAHKLLAPKKHVQKRYKAMLDGPVGDHEIQMFKEGILIDQKYRCLPAELILNGSDPESEDVDVLIYEGKFHQIKRMFEAVGRIVVKLERTEMGPYLLDGTIERGEYKEFEPKSDI